MAIAGNWKSSLNQPYATALKQGTGWNPVHGQRSDDGRNLAPDPTTGEVPAEFLSTEQYGYTPEDSASQIWGYGPDTGTSDRPGWNVLDDRAAVQEDWPSWGPTRSGVPGGGVIRSVDRGADATNTAKQVTTPAAAGWENKQLGDIESSTVSDPSQYEIDTSMTQLYKVRSGSQRGPGSASEYTAPIESPRPTWAQRKFTPSTDGRLGDMLPKGQELVIRPWRYRSAGIGQNVQRLQPNEMYVSDPMQWTPTPDPWQGLSVPTTAVPGFIDEGWGDF